MHRGELREPRRDNAGAPLDPDTRATPKAPHGAFAAICCAGTPRTPHIGRAGWFGRRMCMPHQCFQPSKR